MGFLEEAIGCGKEISSGALRKKTGHLLENGAGEKTAAAIGTKREQRS